MCDIDLEFSMLEKWNFQDSILLQRKEPMYKAVILVIAAFAGDMR